MSHWENVLFVWLSKGKILNFEALSIRLTQQDFGMSILELWIIKEVALRPWKFEKPKVRREGNEVWHGT